MVPQVLRVACRGSRLSRTQTQEALESILPALPAGTRFEIVLVDTPGDRDKQTPLTDPNVPDDFFTRDIDETLRRGEVELAVHSAKDLPKLPPAGLVVATLLPGKDPRDALVFRAGWDRAKPPAVIGTSSPRRTAEIAKRFPDAKTVALRGAIDERIAKLDSGEYDAIIVAACALQRLGMAERIDEFLPYESVPLQGRLAVVVRSDADEFIGMLKATDFRLRLLDAPLAVAPASADTGGKTATLFVGTNPERFQKYAPLIHWPLIERVPRDRAERVKVLAATLDAVRGVLLASPFAVRCFVDALMHWKDARAMVGKILLAVGPSTAREIEQMGLQARVAPTDFGGLGSLLEQVDDSMAGMYLYPCSEAAPTDSRAAEAATKGIELMPFAFYENEPRTPGPLPAQPFGQVLFTSASTVTAYFSNYPEEIHSPRIWLAIGPSTKEALRQLGLKGVMIGED